MVEMYARKVPVIYSSIKASEREGPVKSRKNNYLHTRNAKRAVMLQGKTAKRIITDIF